MSAPKTDLDQQKQRHRGPLLGMRAVVLWALVLLALLGVYLITRDDPATTTTVPPAATTAEPAPATTEPAPAAQ